MKEKLLIKNIIFIESNLFFVGLPWTPKVRQKDVDTFLEVSRLKFVGYNLEGDRQSLAGLPQPILEGVNTLKRVSKIIVHLTIKI